MKENVKTLPIAEINTNNESETRKQLNWYIDKLSTKKQKKLLSHAQYLYSKVN